MCNSKKGSLWRVLIASMLMLSIMLSACGPTPEPQKVVETVVVKETVPIKETVIVAGTPQVVTEEKVVTATPTPVEEMPYGLKPGKPYAGQTIRILMTGPVPQYQAMMNRSPEFTELTGIDVEYEFIPWSSFQEKVTTDGVAQAGAFDVYPYMDAWGPSFAPFLLPIDDYMKEAGIDWSEFPAAYHDGACYADGKCYGIPLRGHPQILYYRKDVFDQLGLKVPTTFAELEEVSKVIQEKTDLYGFSICYGTGHAGQNLMTWVPFLWGNGSDIFDENWQPIFNNEAGVEATQRHVDLLLKHQIVPPGSVVWGESEMVTSMKQGESAMMITWWWLFPDFSNPEITVEAALNNVAFAAPPGWEGKESVPYTLSMPIGINRFSKVPDAAWEYIKMMTHPSVEKDRVLDKSDPSILDIVATHLSVLMDEEVNKVNGGIHKAGYESVKRADIMPMIPEWAEVSSVLEAAIQEMASGAPVKETLDAAAEEVYGIMERAGYYD